MCYAIPGRVTALLDRTAIVDYFGESKRVINELTELQIGDYIYAQGGFVIQTVAEQEARDLLETWRELFFSLRETDLRLSKRSAETLGVDPAFSRILDKVAEGRLPKRDELLRLMNSTDPNELTLLFKVANFLRQKHLKNACCVHGIIEFSNYCQNDCAYCGIRLSNIDLPRYRLTDEEILSAVGEAVETHGFRALVLQSGEDPHFTPDRLAAIIKEIKKRYAVLIFISVGEVGREGLAKLYAAGARGILIRFETSNPKLYAELHPGEELETRLQEIRTAYELGYLVLTGGLIGLPGQTNEDLLNDIMLTKELNAEMFSFGPVLPKGPSRDLVLKVLAVGRLVDPENAKIVVTTGFETLDCDARRQGLLAGANSLMINVTPLKYQRLYQLYPNRAHLEEKIEEQIKETILLLHSLGRAPTDLGI